MIRKQIDNINKHERQTFKYLLAQISSAFTIEYKGNKAFITYHEPYNMDDEGLSAKSRHLKAFNKMLEAFRRFQFDNPSEAQAVKLSGRF